MLNDLFTERAVLSGIIKYGSDAFLDCSDILEPDTFTIDSNQFIYKCLVDIFNQDNNSKVDIPSIISVAKKLGFYEYLSTIDERRHLQSITSIHIELSNVRKSAIKIKKLQICRNVKDRLRNSIKEIDDFTGDETVDEIISRIENPILDISNELSDTNSGKISGLNDDLDDYIQAVITNKGKSIGISSGYKVYDRFIGGGFRKGTVNLLGARTGIGKSLISLNIALHIAGKLNIPVLYVDTEMVNYDHYPRELAILSGLPAFSIEDGSFAKNRDAKRNIDNCIQKLKTFPIKYVSTNNKSFEEALSIIRRWVLKEVGLNDDGYAKDCLVIYDYFKMASVDDLNKTIQEFQLLGVLMDRLRGVAAQYRFPVFALVQLNRDGITRDDTGVVSGSDRITHPVASFSIYRVKEGKEIGEDGPANGNRKLIILKSRHGKTNNPFDYICMNMDDENCRITELQLKSDSKDELELTDWEKDDIEQSTT